MLIQVYLNQLMFPTQPIYLFVTQNTGSQNWKLRKVKNFRRGWIKVSNPLLYSCSDSASCMCWLCPQVTFLHYSKMASDSHVISPRRSENFCPSNHWIKLSASPLRTYSNNVSTSKLIGKNNMAKRIMCIGWLSPRWITFKRAFSAMVAKWL